MAHYFSIEPDPLPHICPTVTFPRVAYPVLALSMLKKLPFVTSHGFLLQYCFP